MAKFKTFLSEEPQPFRHFSAARSMRTCFFTDVEHLRHAIQGLFPEALPASLFSSAVYLPSGAQWENIWIPPE